MKELPKGCILQRDKESYGIRVTPPSGVVTPDDLETIAKVARKYDVPLLKITSGQRMTLIGLTDENVHEACEELPYKVAGHYVQACPGNQWCKLGLQDALQMAGVVEERFSSFGVPKLKFGVSGCPTCCAECYVRDLGLVGSRKGWTLLIGGNAGRRARVADVLAEELSTEAVLDLMEKFLNFYRDNCKPKQRVARFVEERGIDAIREELL